MEKVWNIEFRLRNKDKINETKIFLEDKMDGILKEKYGENYTILSKEIKEHDKNYTFEEHYIRLTATVNIPDELARR